MKKRNSAEKNKLYQELDKLINSAQLNDQLIKLVYVTDSDADSYLTYLINPDDIDLIKKGKNDFKLLVTENRFSAGICSKNIDFCANDSHKIIYLIF